MIEMHEFGVGRDDGVAVQPEVTFYSTKGKRLCDVLVATTGLALLAPLLVVLAALVKLSSAGPVLFRQERVGRAGKIFLIAKFRSMYLGSDRQGLQITSADDPRITPVGRILRRFKLDELPQLWNVLKGDMSLVGPRPEVACYVASYSPAQRRVLSARPGITDPASIVYRNEDEILGRQPEADRYYRDVVLPHKLKMNLDYLSQMSFSYDLALVLRTTACIFLPQRLRTNPTQFS